MCCWKIEIGWQSTLKPKAPADMSYLIRAQAVQLSSQDLLHASALSQELSWRSLCQQSLWSWQTAAPSVVQTPEVPLIPEMAARESVLSYRSRFDLFFPKHKVSSSCSFSPRCNRQTLESFIPGRPLDKEQGWQSSGPKGVVGKQQRLLRRSPTTFQRLFQVV